MFHNSSKGNASKPWWIILRSKNIEKNAQILSTSYGCALWYGWELHILWTMAPRLCNGGALPRNYLNGLEIGALVATLLL